MFFFFKLVCVARLLKALFFNLIATPIKVSMILDKQKQVNFTR